MVELAAYVARDFSLPEPPSRVVRFLRHNEALLHRILGADRVQRLSPETYRLTLGRYGALGFYLRPVMDLLFERADDLLLLMSSVGCVVREASHRDFALDAAVAARAVLRPVPEGTRARIEASAKVAMEVPAFLRLVPVALLRAAGNAVIETAMLGFADRIIPIVRSELAGASVG